MPTSCDIQGYFSMPLKSLIHAKTFTLLLITFDKLKPHFQDMKLKSSRIIKNHALIFIKIFSLSFFYKKHMKLLFSLFVSPVMTCKHHEGLGIDVNIKIAFNNPWKYKKWESKVDRAHQREMHLCLKNGMIFAIS